MQYLPIIGLETHIELSTNSKMFCACSAHYFGEEPNTHICPVCLGLPGALPVPNKTAIDWCIKIALALNCDISLYSKFDRKNYFYPDLAKGYQISQYDLPFGQSGWMELSNGRKIGIRRVHMEEDTGKLIHQPVDGIEVSLIDFNRSGVPLVEIVTEPDFHDSAEVKEYLQKLQQIVRYLGVSNADMEKGDMRLEPNISVLATSNTQTSNLKETELPPYKVEVKNINSFRFVERAIEYEVKRHREILEKGEIPLQETRGWNEAENKTVSQRTKEEAKDYRYFPDPDIPPFEFEESYIDELMMEIPELPDAKRKRFTEEFGIRDYDSEILTRDKKMADYFEEAVIVGKQHAVTAKQIANFIINIKPDIEKLLPAQIVQRIVEKSKVEEVDEKELENVINQVLQENEKAVQDFKSGKESVIMFLLGQTMRKLGKKADAQTVLAQLKSHLQD